MMIVFVTGISGAGRAQYVQKVVKFAAKKGKKVKVFSVGKMILAQAKKMEMNITKANVLNAAPYTLKALRSAVFEQIISESKKYKNVIVESHATFFWNKIFTNAYDWHYLRKLKPDMFITITGNAPTIEKKLQTSKQWVNQGMTEDDVLLWQNIEVNAGLSWSDLFKRPHFACASGQPASTLFKLMFYPQMEPIYASFPMTNLKNPAGKKRIMDFVKKLNNYFVVFDPATIELGPITTQVDAMQCVNRDLFWMIEQSTKVIAIFPEIVLSTGLINELREGFETNKEVWLIFPRDMKSPFTTYYTHKTFSSEQELYAHIKKQGYKAYPQAN